jgi:hypothetical protein
MPQSNRHQDTSRETQGRTSAPPGGGGFASAPAEPAQGARTGSATQGGQGGWSGGAMMAGARERVESFGTAAGETIGEHPMVSILAGFGVGFGVGFALGWLLAPEESWGSRTRRSFDSFSDVFHDLRHTLRELPHATAESVASAFRR